MCDLLRRNEGNKSRVTKMMMYGPTSGRGQQDTGGWTMAVGVGVEVMRETLLSLRTVKVHGRARVVCVVLRSGRVQVNGNGNEGESESRDTACNGDRGNE